MVESLPSHRAVESAKAEKAACLFNKVSTSTNIGRYTAKINPNYLEVDAGLPPETPWVDKTGQK
jgi:hypothetical protein